MVGSYVPLLTVYPSRASHRGTAATVKNIKKASKLQYHFFTTAAINKTAADIQLFTEIVYTQ